MAPGDLTRNELIQLVAKIMRAETLDEAREDRLVALFDESVAHPEASDLIFYPHKHFGEGYRHQDPTPVLLLVP